MRLKTDDTEASVVDDLAVVVRDLCGLIFVIWVGSVWFRRRSKRLRAEAEAESQGALQAVDVQESRRGGSALIQRLRAAGPDPQLAAGLRFGDEPSPRRSRLHLGGLVFTSRAGARELPGCGHCALVCGVMLVPLCFLGLVLHQSAVDEKLMAKL